MLKWDQIEEGEGLVFVPKDDDNEDHDFDDDNDNDDVFSTSQLT